MRGQSQGRGYAATDASDPALNFQPIGKALAAPTHHRIPRDSGAGRRPAVMVIHTCPCCNREPQEAVRLDGQLACRGCTGACGLCGEVCLPGDETCHECARHLQPAVAS